MTGWDEFAAQDLLDAMEDLAVLEVDYQCVDGFTIEGLRVIPRSTRKDFPLGEVVVADRLIVSVPASLLDLGTPDLPIPVTPTPYRDGVGGDVVVLYPSDPERREEWTVVEADHDRRIGLWTLTCENNIRVGPGARY